MNERPDNAGMIEAGFQMREVMRPFFEALEGEVAHLKSNGWSDSQARAIVSYMLGWRPADGSKPDGVS